MINKLIVNADDFGMCEGNTIGILLAHKKGIVTSTTLMMNMPFCDEAIELAKDYPDLGLGVHLNITLGKPLTDISCVDEEGNFIQPSHNHGQKPIVEYNELYKEWKAQIELFIKKVGHLPTHLDSHHHVHLLEPHHEVIKQLAKEYHVPIRQREKIMDPYILCDTTFEDEDLDYFLNIMKKNTGTIEIMTHPALLDQRLYDISSYAIPRMRELDILTSSTVKEFIKDNHIELINYSQI